MFPRVTVPLRVWKGKGMKITSALLAAQAMARITRFSPDEVLKALQNGSGVVVDIREKDEVTETGIIPGAIHIPRGVLEFHVDPGSPDYRADLTPEHAVILVCEDGQRSALATETLKTLGFPHVAHLSGGFQAWKRQGLPISDAFGEETT